jgi:hypothetical protein
MTFAALGKALQTLDLTSELLAIGVVEDGAPIGLCIARARVGSPAEILSIYVRAPFWNRGLGTQLLKLTEQALRERTCPAAIFGYTTEGKCVPAVERVLAKAGWPTPETKMILASISPEISQHAEWITVLKVPDWITVFPWQELTPAERSNLEAAKSTIPTALWPFAPDEFPLELSNSLGLRTGGEVIGWVICHRVDPKLIRYTMFYVREPWRTPDLSFALLAEAIRRKQQVHPPTVIASLAVQVENKPMLRVLERKLKPFALSWHEKRASVKLLGAADSPAASS